MEKLLNLAEGLFRPGTPIPPSPGRKRKEKEKRKEEAEYLAREKWLKEREHCKGSGDVQKPSR